MKRVCGGLLQSPQNLHGTLLMWGAFLPHSIYMGTVGDEKTFQTLVCNRAEELLHDEEEKKKKSQLLFK